MADSQLTIPGETGHHAPPHKSHYPLRLVLDLLAPVAEELAKTALLLVLLMLTLWGILEIFRAGSTGGAWY